MENDQPTSLFGMQVDPLAQSRLNTIGTWARFIAVTALVITALGALLLFIAREKIMDLFGSVMSVDTSGAGIIIGVFAFFCVFIILLFIFLLRAAILIKRGVLAKNSDTVAEGFGALKTYFILSMVILLLSLLGNLIGTINN
jgi:hypothetical protein